MGKIVIKIDGNKYSAATILALISTGYEVTIRHSDKHIAEVTTDSLIIDDVIDEYPTDVSDPVPPTQFFDKKPRRKGQRKHLRDWER